ncbi:hypothetical protein WIS52_16460 [Pseudonocardia nematodicida]|uniref:DUF2269 domain-containing protein n=1 Tax=Pseudonocardia nematodicida TaxID=1206997 RepID=A0ABV1KC73_9PSEU
MTAVATRVAAPRRLARRPRAALRTAHVLLAVGWTGLSLVMLVLPAAVLVQGLGAVFAVEAMALVGGGIIPFFAVGTVLTGVALGLGTPWGLFRHRWVIVKSVLALVVIVSSVVLNTRWIDAVAATTASPEEPVLWSLVLSSALHQVMLLTATVLSVEKPRLTGNQKVA